MSFLNILGNALSSLFLANPLANPSILVSIALVVIIAAVLALISKLLKQEFILAYILAGIIIGPLVLGLIKDPSLVNGLAEIGITFLLFAAGLEMSLNKFKGRISTILLVGIIQVAAVVLLCFFTLQTFLFSRTESIWLGVAIALSSTVVITKIFSDKNELSTLHARLIIGIMFVQDIVAIGALALLTKDFSLVSIILSVVKLVLLVGLAFLLNFAVKPVMKKSASSSELLLVMSIAFLFLFVAISYFLQLSIAIGAFIAGIMLANTPYKIEIESKTKTLRDFFSIMFFVAIGMWLTNLSRFLLLPLIVVLFILILFEPLVTAVIIRLSGYKSKTSLQVGFAFAQVSEFSLILMLAALNIGIISQTAFDLIVVVAVVSIAITQYTIKAGEPLARLFSKLFSFIKVPTHKESKFTNVGIGKKTILLVGCHRMGSIYLKNLEKYRNKILVVDYNPEIIQALSKQKVSCIYGDADSHELLSKLPTQNLKLVLSTIPKKEENLFIIKHFKKLSDKIFVVVTAQKIDDALEFYKEGADYVLLPIIIGAEQCLDMIKNLNKKEFHELKREHIGYLKDLHRYLY